MTAGEGTLLPIHQGLIRNAEERRALETYCGQAFFAGSGPAGRCCIECLHWLGKPTTKAAICVQHRRLTGKRRSSKVPASAKACKYFAEREQTKFVSREKGGSP
jgi:hypothetical protein